MTIAQMFMIATALAMDAFAASISAGIALPEVKPRQTLRVALHFGGFQGGMVVAGWFAGRSLQPLVSAFDHWVAFGLLVFIGSKMIVESTRRHQSSKKKEGIGELRLLALSVATSIDALAVGIGLAFIKAAIWQAAIITALVTAILSAAGIEAGDHFFPARLGRWAEALGGAMLCVIGVKVLVDHLA